MSNLNYQKLKGIMKSFYKLACIGLCALLPLACTSQSKTKEGPKISKANAVVNPTEGNKTWGNITFTETDEGVQIVANVQGLPPGGKHGFHIHEFGDCSSSDASSAGAHYNPTKHKHGGPEDADRHEGDLGNLEADSQGHATYERLDKVITLNGPNSILGKSVVIHADEDDFKTQPTGNSGKRIACGLIMPLE